MTNMNVYWNEDYCGSTTEFETLKKSKHIHAVLNAHEELSQWVRLRDPSSIVGALPTAQSLLAEGVDAEYLQAIMTGRPRGLAESNGFDWDGALHPMVLNSMAGVFCAVMDVTNGYDHSCSLSTGMHHATRQKGKAFCTVNTLALGAIFSQKFFNAPVVLDLDAHCGGGTNAYIQGTEVKQVDLSTQSLDSYDSNANSQLDICGNEDMYLSMVATSLQKLSNIGPDIVFYNAGVDIYPWVPSELVIQREQMVANRMRTLGVPTVIVMAGGYGDIEDIVPLHVSTICAFAAPHLLASRVAAGQPNAGQFIDPILALNHSNL